MYKINEIDESTIKRYFKEWSYFYLQPNILFLPLSSYISSMDLCKTHL